MPGGLGSGHAVAHQAKVGGWTETRPVSLGLLPSGSDPVGEWCVHRQPPTVYLDHSQDFRKRRENLMIFSLDTFDEDYGRVIHEACPKVST